MFKRILILLVLVFANNSLATIDFNKKTMLNILGMGLMLYGGNEVIDDIMGLDSCKEKWEKRLELYKNKSQNQTDVLGFVQVAAPIYYLRNLLVSIVGFSLIKNSHP